MPNLETQEDLILPYFPPAPSCDHVEVSLDMHWTLQIILLNPHRLEIQRKKSSVWPPRQDEQEMHGTGTAAPHTCHRWARQHPPASTVVSYIFPCPSTISSFPTWAVGVWCHFKLYNVILAHQNHGTVSLPQQLRQICQGYRIWEAEDYTCCCNPCSHKDLNISVQHFTEESALKWAYTSEKNILYVTKVCLKKPQIYVPCFCTNWSPVNTWEI